jgi:molybdopterin-guanine dinucleotide biosynthesis protein A
MDAHFIRRNIVTLHHFSLTFMNESGIKMTGILLAGGKSKRFGRDKGNIWLNNKRLYEYPLSILERTCQEILISTCQENNYPLNHQCICDEIKGIGPIGGIYSCMKQSTTDLNLILSYDMPLVNEGLITYLINEWEDEEILLPALADGRPQTLCGLYSKRVTGVLEAMITQKDYAVRNMLSNTQSRVVKIPEEFPWWSPDLFLSINREEDLLRLPSDICLKRDEE